MQTEHYAMATACHACAGCYVLLESMSGRMVSPHDRFCCHDGHDWCSLDVWTSGRLDVAHWGFVGMLNPVNRSELKDPNTSSHIWSVESCFVSNTRSNTRSNICSNTFYGTWTAC